MKLEFRRTASAPVGGHGQSSTPFGVVPPASASLHQVNLEYLSRGVIVKDGLAWRSDALVVAPTATPP